jgi:zinc transport system ATP-binding protein
MKNAIPIIELKNVSFSYDKIPVLEEVNVTVHRDEIVSIVGPNGGGKTTLLRLILGLLQPNSGTIRVFGGSPEAARLRIGYMPQHVQHDRDFPVSVKDVVLMGRLGHTRRPFGRYSKEDHAAVRDALEQVGLLDEINRSFVKLSGGQRQRTLIARAICTEPELLLLDEPTSNVDGRSESELAELLDKLGERMSIVMVSHDLGFVSKLVRRVICVNRRVVIHPVDRVTGQALQEVYGHDLSVVHHDKRN